MQQVAQVSKSNGTDGEVVISFRDIDPDDINLKEPVFIVFDGLPVPFFIDSFIRRGQSKALVRLTGISSQEDAEEIIGKAVYLEDDQMPQMTFEEDGFAVLIGWTVLTPEIPDQCGIDKDTTDAGLINVKKGPEESGSLIEVGEITDFMDIPNNPCIEVETINGAVILPLHEDFIISIDPEYQEIIMQIPAGLI